MEYVARAPQFRAPPFLLSRRQFRPRSGPSQAAAPPRRTFSFAVDPAWSAPSPTSRLAQVLAFVQPPAFGLKIGRARRHSFSHAGMRDRCGDLVAWRNVLYGASTALTIGRQRDASCVFSNYGDDAVYA
jgi:hypothetical protein